MYVHPYEFLFAYFDHQLKVMCNTPWTHASSTCRITWSPAEILTTRKKNVFICQTPDKMTDYPNVSCLYSSKQFYSWLASSSTKYDNAHVVSLLADNWDRCSLVSALICVSEFTSRLKRGRIFSTCEDTSVSK
jgi:hypothetical protein